MKLVEDNEKTSQEEKNKFEDEMNDLLLVHESCESVGTVLQEEKCKMSFCSNRRKTMNPFIKFNNFGFCNKDFLD